MKNANATHIVTDVGNKIILVVTPSIEVAIFVQRHVLDTKISSVPSGRWIKEMVPNLMKDEFNMLKDLSTVLGVIEPPVSDITKEKWRRAKLLADGYQYLLWHANLATESYWSTASLDYDDLPVMPLMIQELIELYAVSKNLSEDEAEKQINFDLDNLKTNALRRKEILWSNEGKLLLVDTQEQLDAFKRGVRLGTVVGGNV